MGDGIVSCALVVRTVHGGGRHCGGRSCDMNVVVHPPPPPSVTVHRNAPAAAPLRDVNTRDLVVFERRRAAVTRERKRRDEIKNAVFLNAFYYLFVYFYFIFFCFSFSFSSGTVRKRRKSARDVTRTIRGCDTNTPGRVVVVAAATTTACDEGRCYTGVPTRARFHAYTYVGRSSAARRRACASRGIDAPPPPPQSHDS